MNTERRLEAAFDVLPTGVDEEVRICCPFCKDVLGRPDTKHHLYVNLAKDLFICYRCDTRGHVSRLLGPGDGTDPLTEDWHAKVLSLLEPPEESGTAPRSGTDSEEARLPGGTTPVRPGSLAARYLAARGITPFTIQRYGMRDWPEAHRVVIPTVRDGTVEFWVARSYVGDEPKYLNPNHRIHGGSLRRNVLFGYDQARGQKQVILTEGVFSALAIGPHAVASFGKVVTDAQIRLLASLRAEDYVVALDADAAREAWAVAERIHERVPPRASVRVVSWEGLPPESDPAEVDPDVIQERIRGARPFDWNALVLHYLT